MAWNTSRAYLDLLAHATGYTNILSILTLKCKAYFHDTQCNLNYNLGLQGSSGQNIPLRECRMHQTPISQAAAGSKALKYPINNTYTVKLFPHQILLNRAVSINYTEQFITLDLTNKA